VFHYHDKGSMATIGRSSAVAQFHGLKLSGMPAWLAWLFVHLMFLIGFRSRAQVLWDWFWAYLHFQRGARLITGISRSIVPPVVPNAATGAPPPEAPK
jgi:NADH dehydrogenase